MSRVAKNISHLNRSSRNWTGLVLQKDQMLLGHFQRFLVGTVMNLQKDSFLGRMVMPKGIYWLVTAVLSQDMLSNLQVLHLSGAKVQRLDRGKLAEAKVEPIAARVEIAQSTAHTGNGIGITEVGVATARVASVAQAIHVQRATIGAGNALDIVGVAQRTQIRTGLTR